MLRVLLKTQTKKIQLSKVFFLPKPLANNLMVCSERMKTHLRNYKKNKPFFFFVLSKLTFLLV